MVGGVLTSPLEVVKTRLQGTYNKEGLANTQHRFGTRTVRALTHLHAEGGVRALYRGMVPHLVGVVPARALYFGTFSWSKRELGKHLQLDPHGMLLNWLGGVAAGNVTLSVLRVVFFFRLTPSALLLYRRRDHHVNVAGVGGQDTPAAAGGQWHGLGGARNRRAAVP